jgi:hypothetical protein
MIRRMNKSYIKPRPEKWFVKFLIPAAALLLLFLSFNLIAPASALAETAALEIFGEGVTTSLKLTQAELEAMEQYEHVYSTINTWPTKRWYIARGVKLRDLLSMAGFKEEEATSIKFVAADDYEMTLTVKELLGDKRYYFPGLKENHPTEGSIPGSSEGAVEVEPILALLSAEDSEDPEEMDDRNAPMLMLGQRAVTEQTWLLYVKYVKKIEVDTTPLEKWDAPKVNVPDGTALPPGTELKMENKNTDADKIYYTTDGSEPTLNSPMFNWSARRWWEQREDVDSINIPIEIVEEMISDSIDGRDVVVLKMKTIGPGREDSEVATYTFYIDPEADDPTKIPGGPPSGVFLDQNALDLPVGHTFQLEATVEPFNAINKNVIWRSSDTSVATVDTRGLVTVVGSGTAVITVETVDGSFKATCVINGPDGEAGESDIAAAEKDILPEEEKPEDPPEQLPKVDEQSLAEEGAKTPASTVAEKPETPTQASEPEDTDPQYPEEDPVSPASAAENEPPLPEGNWDHLAKKDDLSVAVDTSDESTARPESSHPEVQVFELSLGHTVPLPMPEQQKDLDLFTAAIFLFFVLSGAGKKYIEYAKE